MEVGCDSVGVADPVVGRVAGSAADPSDVWLVTQGDRRVEVVWPAGFTARFDERVELIDDQGSHVAFAGDVFYMQVPSSSAAGTADDPYFATGLLAAGPDFDLQRPSEAPWTGCYGRTA
jgi:hypothetical protein